MLNLTIPVKFTDKEQATIDALMSETKADGSPKYTGPEMWQKGTNDLKAIKHKISTHSLSQQRCLCAFCESLLDHTNAIEHIAPKKNHRRFTFTPKNLVVSCSNCNCKSIKGERETINGAENPNYEDNAFLILHPFLDDDPESQFAYVDDEHLVYDKEHCTDMAKETIKFFHWDELVAYNKRVQRNAIKDLPLDVAQYIKEISSYKE